MSSKSSKIAQKIAANSLYGSLSNVSPKGGWLNWFNKMYDDDSAKVMPYKAAHAELIKRKKNRPGGEHKIVKVNSGQYYVKTTFKPLIFSDAHLDQTRKDNVWFVDHVGLLKDKKSSYDPAEMVKLFDYIRPTGTPIYHSIKSRTNTGPGKFIFDMEADFGQFGKEFNALSESKGQTEDQASTHVGSSPEGSV